ncbi:uncharacterized protein LOC119103360 [Pollicipes pollicipes]|uniref:uncharacterized protein LOC119103360 n=1 Tax=Pollicipes pollicipes TaxID=41117 RepID=UPI00188508D4|nr:uncharacterized protein LOC119103360 [Pollicipes pollicipes]
MFGSSLPRPVLYGLAAVGFLNSVLMWAAMNILHWLSPSLYERCLHWRCALSKITFPNAKYKFDDSVLIRQWPLVMLWWRMAVAEIRKQAVQGQRSPDPRLVSLDLQRRPRLLELQRADRPLVLVFGSAT